jgi:chromate transporter
VARDVNRTFGGGIAAMELLRRTSMQRGWMHAADHALLVAVSRLTPGTNILAYCVALGWRMHRAAGSAVALLAASVPAAVIVFTVAATLVRVDRYRSVQVLLAFAMFVAALLVFSTAWHLLRPYMTARRRLAVVVIAVSLGLFGLAVSPVRILLAAAAIGALWPAAGHDGGAAASPPSTRLPGSAP